MLKFSSCIFFILALFAMHPVKAQTELMWVNGYNNATGISTVIDHNGDVITIGRSSINTDMDPSSGISLSNGNCFIQKTDAFGFHKWNVTLNTNYATLFNVNIDSNNDIYIFGHYMYTVDFDPGQGTFNLSTGYPAVPIRNIFILKLNSNGDFLWVKGILSPLDNLNFTNQFINSSDEIFVTGTFFASAWIGDTTFNSEDGARDIFFTKLTTNGDFEWARHLKGNDSDVSVSILSDNTSAIYLSGFFSDSLDFDPSDAENILFSEGGSDFFVAKFSDTGGLKWVDHWVTNSNLSTRIHDVEIFSDTILYILSEFTDTIDADPGIGTQNLIGSEISNGLLISIDSAGNFKWVKKYDFNSPSSLTNKIEINSQGNLFALINFQDTINMGDSINPNFIASRGNTDFIIAHFSQNGDVIEVNQFGGPGNDNAIAININDFNDLVTTGSFKDICDFSYGSSTSQLTSSWMNADAFILKLSNFVEIKENPLSTDLDNSISLYPNPANDYLTIISYENKILNIKMTDVSGKIYQTLSNVNSESYVINLNQMSRSIYFLIIETENGKIVKKVVKD